MGARLSEPRPTRMLLTAEDLTLLHTWLTERETAILDELDAVKAPEALVDAAERLKATRALHAKVEDGIERCWTPPEGEKATDEQKATRRNLDAPLPGGTGE